MKRATQIQSLINAIQEHAIKYGNNNARIYAELTVQELNKWAQQNRASVFYGDSDSILNLDIINHFVIVARDFKYLINLQHT
jgi:hypothetical protein